MCSPTCAGCGRTPIEIGEYKHNGEGLTADEFVRQEEGTYNPDTNHFACTECYIRMGMPTAAGRGWKAP
jgi:hypothetical protein